MVSRTPYPYGMLWRALAISLVAHIVLLLQPGISASSREVTKPQSLMAFLKPSSSGAPIGVAQNSQVPSPRHRAPLASVAATAVTAPKNTNRPEAAGQDDAAIGASITGRKSILKEAVGTGSELDQVSDFAEDRKSYALAVWAEAGRNKKYPEHAYLAGWSGKADILIPVGIGGIVLQPRLAQSSGYADLDKAALAMVDAAVKKTSVPENLRNRRFDVTLPIVFDLKNE